MNIPKIVYVVVCGNILGYCTPDNKIGVLQASILRGASHSAKDGPIPMPLNPADIRPATLADFQQFMMLPPPLGIDKNGIEC